MRITAISKEMKVDFQSGSHSLAKIEVKQGKMSLATKNNRGNDRKNAKTVHSIYHESCNKKLSQKSVQ